MAVKNIAESLGFYVEPYHSVQEILFSNGESTGIYLSNDDTYCMYVVQETAEEAMVMPKEGTSLHTLLQALHKYVDNVWMTNSLTFLRAWIIRCEVKEILGVWIEPAALAITVRRLRETQNITHICAHDIVAALRPQLQNAALN